MTKERLRLNLAKIDTGENGERVDYHEADVGFRRRLDALIPSDMADRVQKILKSKLSDEDDESAEAVNM
ncbi:MAG: hypothetical protein P9L94_08375 [Candidatus Hinthialibacter antarcticus]|nr:hypothetical protein [Candidatus Hinthialibacter antarcticus]